MSVKRTVSKITSGKITVGKFGLVAAILLNLRLGLAAEVSAFAPAAASVDLHAHLFMHEGAGVNWLGDFFGPVQSESWRDRLRGKVNSAGLDDSGFGVVVVALYSHPLFKGSQRDSIRRQIESAKKFVSEHPRWVIARTPADLEKAMIDRRPSLIFSLEGADGVLETESDFSEFIDTEGIKIVTPVHFIDDSIGGAALMPGALGAFANPIGWISSKSQSGLYTGSEPVPQNEVVPHSPQGMRSSGRFLVEQLLRRGVWIDLSHSSDAFAADLLPMLREAHQPLLITHTMLRRYYHSERGVPLKLLEAVKATNGIVGVLPSDDIVGKAPAMVVSGKTVCSGGVGAYMTQVDEIAAIIGLDSVGIGSDTNAPLRFLPADCERRELDPKGFYSYSQYPVLRELMGLKGPGLTGERFLRAWREVKPSILQH